jgi:AAA domain, putative AbiEii toxin, Type IV TA system
LKEEDRVKPLFEGFSRIFEATEETFEQSTYGELSLDKYSDFESLKNSRESLRYKLWWAYNNKGKTDAYNSISTQFLEIFPNFTSFSMSVFQFPPHGKEEVTNWLYTHLEERGTQMGLDYDSLASGMQRTLDFLGQIHFLPDNSVILIDEFENGLGSNCIDLVADAIQNAGRGLQLIITSHHPYIINKISFKHWKLVTRKGGVVSTHPASEFGLGRSRHENFSQLIQLEAFQTGMMPE